MRTRFIVLRDSGAGWIRYFVSGYLRVIGMEEVDNNQLIECNLKTDIVYTEKGWFKINERINLPWIAQLN